MAERVDVAIVGGGPAGQAAALQLNDLGLSVAVIDEQPRPGGQILRQPPSAFAVRGWMADHSYAALRARLARFEAASDIAWLGGRSVLGLAPSAGGGFHITFSSAEGLGGLDSRRVLVAAGCQDLAVPLPGWTLPGVYAAGGLQAFFKSQRIVPDGRIVLAGTHPLQLLVAAQLAEAGAEVAAVCFAQPFAQMAAAMTAAPAAAARHIGPLLSAAGAYRALRRRGVAVRFGSPVERIVGEDRVQGAIIGSRTIACETVGLCYGFVPQSALPRMAGADMRKAGRAGGWAAVHDRWMRSTMTGLFVAGETTGVAGAPAALAAGEIAGTGIALDLGLIDEPAAQRRSAASRAAHARHLRFADLLDDVADPRPYFPALADDTLVCRCEDVPFGDIVPLVGGGSANAIKLTTRCGMGACQGRNCEPTLLRLIGDPGDPGFTARFPARPATIGDLAGQ